MKILRCVSSLAMTGFFIPTLLGSFLSAAPNDYEKVVIHTRDNVRLVGFFHPPEVGHPVVIMLHGLAAVKEEWLPLSDQLNKNGFGWLMYDARGHGDSSLTKASDGSPNGYRYFNRWGTGSEWERMIDDVGAALQFLEKNKQIKRSNIRLMGASLGANVCLRYAALTRLRSKVVMLSPGLNYQEIKTDDAIAKTSDTKILIVAHPADTYAHGSALQLKSINSKIELWSDVKPGHGVQMFDAGLIDRIIDWLK